MNDKHAGKLTVILAVFFVVFALAIPALTQEETTGEIRGTVKDPTGAVIAGATVTVSPAIGVPRTVNSDGDGNYRFFRLPPGTYTLSVEMQGFRKYVESGIIVEVGRRLKIDVELEVGDFAQVVEVVAGAAVIDLTSSKAMVNISAELIEALPKGRGVLNLMAIAPGVRLEPADGGFQLDGSSSSENTYNIEGHDTSNVQTGVIGLNPPQDFFQAVTVKSSGFEAEHGGAMGGVVNVITKRGGSAWHGSGLLYYRQDALDGGPRNLNRRDPTQIVKGQLSEPAVVYNLKKDDYTILEPGFEIGGPFIREKLFFYGGYIPRLNENTRLVDITNAARLGARFFKRTENTHFAEGRLDAHPLTTLHGYALWNYAYTRTTGIDRPDPDDKDGKLNPSAATDPAVRRPDRGNVFPNYLWRVGGDWTPTPKIVVNANFGIWHTDTQDRGTPVGIRHVYSSASAPGLDTSPVDPRFVGPAGFVTLADNRSTLFDTFERKNYDASFAYSFRGAGSHTLKAGFAVNRISNSVNTTRGNTAHTFINWNDTFTPNTAPEALACFGPDGTADGVGGIDGANGGNGCRGNFGYYEVFDFQVRGNVGSNNYGVFVQDSWTIGYGVTANLGIRWDKEYLPSFNAGVVPDVVARPIEFGFADKVGPRLGAAWDVLQKGKLKVYGSWGYFYDIMKYEMPRGSFGGDFWNSCFFTLETSDMTAIAPVQSGGFTCNAGTFGGTPGTFIGVEDFRIPSNTPALIDTTLDPDLKPARVTEYVLGGEWAVTPNIAFEMRYSRKRLRNTIEDVGILGPAGEQFLIVNPGERIAEFPLRNDCPSTNPACTASEVTDNLPAMPKARRDYDGVEFRFNKRFTGNWFFIGSYTWSRLTGNYPGLRNADEDLKQNFGPLDTRDGRASPNVQRAFDQQPMMFDASGSGKPVFGRLPTDRTHTFKFFGGYRLNWWGMSTLISGAQSLFQGNPLTSRWPYAQGDAFVPYFGREVFADITTDANGVWILNGLEEGRRTPWFTNTSANVRHEFKLSQTNEALRFAVELNAENLFNEATIITIKDRADRARGRDVMSFPSAVSNSGESYPTFYAGFDPIAASNAGGALSGLRLDTLYGKPIRIQTPRELRLKLQIIF